MWIYLMALGLALVCGGLYMIRRARQQQHSRLFDVAQELETLELSRREERPSPPKESELQALAKSLARNTSGELGALAVESEMGSPLFALRTEGPQRECTMCRRRFASWMAICPFDNTPLKEPGHAHINVRKIAARRAKANREDMLPRKRCMLCERRYHENLTYCPHDGEKLIQDLREEAEEAPCWELCRSCGQDVIKEESTTLTCRCDEERADHVVINPAIMRTRGIPLSKCPTCGTYGGPGQTHCDAHDEVLLPESVFERHALPAAGHGPTRKLCTRCHRRFSGAYAYCPHDAQRLKNID